MVLGFLVQGLSYRWERGLEDFRKGDDGNCGARRSSSQSPPHFFFAAMFALCLDSAPQRHSAKKRSRECTLRPVHCEASGDGGMARQQRSVALRVQAVGGTLLSQDVLNLEREKETDHSVSRNTTGRRKVFTVQKLRGNLGA